jgi:hypothetical protein
MRKYLLLFVMGVMIVMACSLSCSFVPLDGSKSFFDMRPKEKCLFLIKTYNHQYDDYLKLHQKGNHTDEEKETLKIQYKVISELYPLIGVYVTYAEAGLIPSEEIERQVIKILNGLK